MRVILLVIFTIHLIVFGMLYLRDRHLYQALFAGGFFGLVIYYGINAVTAKAPGWLKIFRYLGLLLLAIGTPLFIQVKPVLGSVVTGIILLFLVAKIINLKQRLMTSPRFVMFVMRAMLWYLKTKDRLKRLFRSNKTLA